MFTISGTTIDISALKKQCYNDSAGGFVSFEGWVRDHNDGRKVERLEYEVYQSMALKEGNKIIEEALKKFDILQARCEHREGLLEIGDMAIWIGVSAKHRRAAFEACQYIIDMIKNNVPIWKKEYYTTGDVEWVQCHQCMNHHD